MFKYEYTVQLIGLPAHPWVCSISFTDKQYEEDVVDYIISSEYHATIEGSLFIPKNAVMMISQITGDILSED